MHVSSIFQKKLGFYTWDEENMRMVRRNNTKRALAGRPRREMQSAKE